jgi:hypothetical protein
VYNFIHENQFSITNNNPTHKYQKAIKLTLKQFDNIIPKERKWKYTNMNPTAPNRHATINLHKQNKPIRPIINWKNAPAYELAKHLTQILHNCLHLPNTYNIQNSTHLTTDLQTMEINEDMRMCSFYIENMYTTIPYIDTINIITNIFKTNSEIDESNWIERIHTRTLKTMTEQNYFQFDQQYYKQTEGLAMGAPTSAILAEMYKHMEHKQIYPILIKH